MESSGRWKQLSRSNRLKMCRAARVLCQTSPQRCRVGWLCNNTNLPPPLQTQPWVPCLLLPPVKAQTWPELLPPANNSVQPVMVQEGRRTDPRKGESFLEEEEEGFSRGKLPQECRWVSKCLGLSFWAVSLLDVAPPPQPLTMQMERRQPFPRAVRLSQQGRVLPGSFPCQSKCSVTALLSCFPAHHHPSANLQFLSVFHDGANEIPGGVFPLK